VYQGIYSLMVLVAQNASRNCQVLSNLSDLFSFQGELSSTIRSVAYTPNPHEAWQSIRMDFIGLFPEVKSSNYLWVVVCYLTLMVHLIPVNTRMTVTDLSWIYLQEVVCLHRLPSSIVLDRDSKFTSKWWWELHWLLSAKLLMSTLFHPQMDGLTEWTNHLIAQIFRGVVAPDQQNWLDKVPMVELGIHMTIA
jgi:hypothetical protein